MGSGYSCSSRDSLSHRVTWKLLNTLKINEKIPLACVPEQLPELSMSDFQVPHCCIAAADGSLFIQTIWLLKLEEKRNHEESMDRIGKMRA